MMDIFYLNQISKDLFITMIDNKMFMHYSLLTYLTYLMSQEILLF